jgi:glycosyltransferase involved in cell wall biosynthesis
VSRPEVTVVIPTRNRAHLLDVTLRSVAAQTATSLEIVVIDEASTDDTAERIRRLDDPRVAYVRHDRPLGVSLARNRGIAEAQGRFIAFLDDDDVWAPDKLADQLGRLRADQRSWAVTGAVAVDDSLTVLTGEPPLPPERIVAELPTYNSVPVGASNVMVRRDVLDKTGGFDPGLRHMADWDLWLRIARIGPPATVVRPLVAYRLHAGSATMDTAYDGAEPLAELNVIADRYGIPADRAAVHRWIAWSALRAGKRTAAVRAYLAATGEGDPKSLGRALIAAVHPGAGRQYFYRPFVQRHQDQSWLEEARAWLRELQASLPEDVV